MSLVLWQYIKQKNTLREMFEGRIYHGISVKCSQKISLGNVQQNNS